MHPNFTDLKVVASEQEREGHVTFGVLYKGVFVPISQHKGGTVEHAVTHQVLADVPLDPSEHDQAIADLNTRLEEAVAETTAVTKQLAALSTKVGALKAPAAPKGAAAAGGSAAKK